MSVFSTPFDDKDYKPVPRNPASRTIEEQQVLSCFNDYYTEARGAKQLIKRMMEDSYLSFRSILSDYSFMSRDIDRLGLAVYIPHTFQAVASIQAQLNGRPPQYRCVATYPGDAKRQSANAVGDLSRAEFNRAKALQSISSSIQDSLIFGTSFLRSRFKYDKRKAKFLKEVTDDRGLVYDEKDRLIYSGWVLEKDHPLTVYLPPTHEHDPQKWPDYIQRTITDVRQEYLYYEAHPGLSYNQNHKYLAPGGNNLEDDMDVLFKMDQSYELGDIRYPGSAGDLFRRRVSSQYASRSIPSKYAAEKFRIYDMVNDVWATIINGELIEYYPNPLDTKELPIEPVRDYRVENSPWGIGEPQLLRHLQAEANALHTFILDAVKYSAAGVFGVNSSALKNPHDMSVYPGKIFDIKNLPNLNINNVVQQLNTGDVKSGSFRMLAENSSMIARTLGTGSAVIGGDPINTSSATESNNLKAAATTRIYERSRVLEQETLVNVVNTQIQFMAQFYDEELIARVAADKFIKFVPGEEKDYPAEKKAADIADGFEVIVYSSDLTQRVDVLVEGESTLPISRAERRVEGMQLLKVATESRRPLTAEEVASDPTIVQRFPQGVPVLDPETVAKRILLPTFTTVDAADDFLFKVEKTEGTQDRERGVGRPPAAINPNAFEGMTEDVAMRAEAQPENMGNNTMERFDQMM